MTDFKTKTGDKVLLVLKNKDKKGEPTIYTKSSQELNYSNMQGEGVEAHMHSTIQFWIALQCQASLSMQDLVIP